MSLDYHYSKGFDRYDIKQVIYIKNKELELKAYLIAEKDGFRKSPDEYWQQAIKGT